MCVDFDFLSYITGQSILIFLIEPQSWQSFSTIQDSQGDVFIHALHLQKEMGMEYIAPKVPIEMLNGGQLARLPFQDGSQTRTANVNTASEDLAKNKIV